MSKFSLFSCISGLRALILEKPLLNLTIFWKVFSLFWKNSLFVSSLHKHLRSNFCGRFIMDLVNVLFCEKFYSFLDFFFKKIPCQI